jgi:redox-sensitive bicupin YhaK (pirin superfamily)
VAWQGPIVMNTEEELRIAFDEYREGIFVKQNKSHLKNAK